MPSPDAALAMPEGGEVDVDGAERPVEPGPGDEDVEEFEVTEIRRRLDPGLYCETDALRRSPDS